MERKGSKTKSRRKRGGPKQGFASVPRLIPTDTMVVKTSWTEGGLSSGTSGTISASLSASVQNSSEFSTYASLFGEVKLLAMRMKFSFISPQDPVYNTNRIVHFGTNMSMNGTTNTAPTAASFVTNLARYQQKNTADWRMQTYSRNVPRNLDFTNIADDCPTLPIPYAGSPGVIQIYGTGHVVSNLVIAPFVVEATYMLKSRV